jgi:hypothetical protein
MGDFISSAVLSAYVPASWFHARGIFKVLRRLEPRLPDVAKMLFLTFTVNPALYEDPEAAFEHSRDRLRRVFHRLRQGVTWEKKFYQIDAPYAVKVEFHKADWAHFHVIFLTRRYLPGSLLNHLWSLGRTNVQRISNRRFRYLLKYVTKGSGLPEWILGRKRLRVFQSSRGFLRRSNENEPKAAQVGPAKRKLRRRVTTLGERLQQWKKSALLKQGEHYNRCILMEPFKVLFDHLVFPVAREGRYLGNGHILINDTTQLIPWLTELNQPT